MVCRFSKWRNIFEWEGCMEEVDFDIGFENGITCGKVERNGGEDLRHRGHGDRIKLS